MEEFLFNGEGALTLDPWNYVAIFQLLESGTIINWYDFDLNREF